MNIQLAVDKATSTIATDGTMKMYIWGAQVEKGTEPTPLIPTTTAARTINTRTNLLKYSEAFDNATFWAKSPLGVGSAPVVTANAAAAPDGTLTADKVDLDLNGGTTSGDWSWIYQNYPGGTAFVTYTLSVWLKAATPSDVGKVIRLTAQGSQDITLTEDWYRHEYTETPTVTATLSLGVRTRGNELTADSASFYMWGMQAEEAAAATNYIPTTTAPVTVTGYIPRGSLVDDLHQALETVLEDTGNINDLWKRYKQLN
jgi:hypothetical protein